MTLREVITEIGRPELLQLPGKGAPGQMLQTWFQLSENDNRAEPDLPRVKFADGRTADVEIKAVPLMLRKRGLTVKERCKVTSIDYADLLLETWPKSRARHKLTVVLFIYYRYAGLKNWPESRVERAIEWFLDNSSSRDTIQRDWQRTWDHVDSGKAHEISEGHALILGASTSGAGRLAKFVAQPNNPGKVARKRSFSLKPAFLRTTYEAVVSPTKFASITTLRGRPLSQDITKEVLSALGRFVGKTMGKIADELTLPKNKSKQGAALLVRRALGVNTDRKQLIELEVAGVKPKTVPTRWKDFYPWQSMSFPAMSLTEFVEEEWEDSQLRAHLDCLLILPTFATVSDQDYLTRELGRPFFWTPSEDEEKGISAEWEQFKQEVLDGRAAYERIDGERISKLTRSSGTQFIHTRPKSETGDDDDVDPYGNPTQKLCFWLNKGFVQGLLQKHLDRRMK